MKSPSTTSRLKQNKPLEIWQSGDWTWEVYRKYQKPEREAQNQFARWFCKVSSPFTQGGYDLGDTYVNDIKGMGAICIYKEIKEEGNE